MNECKKVRNEKPKAIGSCHLHWAIMHHEISRQDTTLFITNKWKARVSKNLKYLEWINYILLVERYMCSGCRSKATEIPWIRVSLTIVNIHFITIFVTCFHIFCRRSRLHSGASAWSESGEVGSDEELTSQWMAPKVTSAEESSRWWTILPRVIRTPEVSVFSVTTQGTRVTFPLARHKNICKSHLRILPPTFMFRDK
jgi:hypothetical protein